MTSVFEIDEETFYTAVNYDIFNTTSLFTQTKITGDIKEPPEVPYEFQNELYLESPALSIKKTNPNSPTKSIKSLSKFQNFKNFELVDNLEEEPDEGK